MQAVIAAQPELPPVASPEQVAGYLQVCTKTICRMLEDGRLKGIRTFPGRGGRWRIRREDVVALLNGAVPA
jgi:excisionase family DNA binding protein